MGIRKVDPNDWLNWGNLGDTLFQIPARRAEARSGGQSRRRSSFLSTSQVFRFLVLSGSPLRSFQAVPAQIISRQQPRGSRTHTAIILSLLIFGQPLFECGDDLLELGVVARVLASALRLVRASALPSCRNAFTVSRYSSPS